jgi:glycolate oxidase FAD binding subunit
MMYGERSAAASGAADDSGSPGTDVLVPVSYAELASHLADAAAHGHAVAIVGRDTNAPAHDRSRQYISLHRLPAVVDHAPGDLVATLAAGVTLGDANRALEANRQRLPLDPFSGDTLSIGALVAANASGPRRHRYGTPRDLILGIEMMLADGRVARAGGRVVKNVAGYDLPRMLCGSCGSLAIVLTATFKVSPTPAVSRTVAIALPDAAGTAAVARAIAETPLTPSALELDATPWTLLVRFESTPTAVSRQTDALLALCAAHRQADAQIAAGAAESALWSSQRDRIWSGPATVLRIGVLPTEVWPVVGQVERLCDGAGIAWHAGGRVALGVLEISLRGQPAAHGSVVTGLRAALGTLGNVVVARREGAAAAAPVDSWGDPGDALPLMRAVKARFDPAGLLNPGRGPFGL